MDRYIFSDSFVVLLTCSRWYLVTCFPPQISFVWTEGRLADLARKMLSAVAYLHQRGIAHRL
jgi:serine/threonine protein kinase